MADSRADILLTINSNLEGIRKAQEAFLSLKQDANKVNETVNGVGARFKSLFTNGAVASFGAMFSAGALGFGKVIDAVNETIGGSSTLANEMKSVTKLTGMSGEAFQVFSRGARIGFDDLVTKLQFFRAKLGEAFTDPKGDAARMFKRVGLDADTLAAQSTDEQLLSVANALSKVTNETQKAALAKELFGRNAAVMIPALQTLAKQGYDGLRTSVEATAGILTNDMANALNKSKRDIEEANNRLSIGFAPTNLRILETSAAVRKFMADQVELIQSLGTAIGTGVLVAAVGKGVPTAFASLKSFFASAGASGMFSSWGAAVGTAFGAAFVVAAGALIIDGLSGLLAKYYRDKLGREKAVADIGGNAVDKMMAAEKAGSPAELDAKNKEIAAMRADYAAKLAELQAPGRTHEESHWQSIPGGGGYMVTEKVAGPSDDDLKKIRAYKQAIDMIDQTNDASYQKKLQADAQKRASESAEAKAMRELKITADEYLKTHRDTTEEHERKLTALKAQKGNLDDQLTATKAEEASLLSEYETKIKAARAAKEEDYAKALEQQRELDIQKVIEKREGIQKRIAEAHLAYLKQKAQEGTLDEKIGAIGVEMAQVAQDNALTSEEKDTKLLGLRQQIIQLQNVEAAKAAAEAAAERQRQYEAEANRIRDNSFLVDREKREQLYLAFKREEETIGKRIVDLQKKVDTEPEGSATKAQAQSELNSLKQRRDVSLPHDMAVNRPQSMVEEITSAMTALRSGFATVATSISEVMSGTINSISGGIQGLLGRTMALGQAARSVYVGIGQSINRSISDAAAQWIIKHTVMAAWSKLFAAQEVATHAGAEAAKTGATAVGAGTRGGIRLGETIFHNLQVAWRVTTHILGEIAKTAATAIQTALRIPMIIAESIGHVIKAGAGAMSAVASIPYVGPILAIAALAAVVAAGMAAVKGVSKGWYNGGYTGPGGKYEEAGPAHKGEVIFSQEDVARHGGPSAVERLRLSSGVYKGSASGATAASQSKPVMGSGAGANGGVNIAYFNTQQDAEAWLRTQGGRRTMIDFNRREAVNMT